MASLKELVSSSKSTSHIFSTQQYPHCYVVFHDGKHCLYNIYTEWDCRKEYLGHKSNLSICSWTVAASLFGKLPFKVRLLPIDEAHIAMSHDDVIKFYGVA